MHGSARQQPDKENRVEDDLLPDEQRLPDVENVAPDLVEPDPADAANPGQQNVNQAALQVELAPLVRRLLNDVALTREERAKIAIFHGQWDKVQRDLTTLQQAQVALQKYDLDHPSLQDPDVPALIRGEAALRANDPDKALILLKGEPSAQAALLRAEAHKMRGDTEAALEELMPVQAAVHKQMPTDAAELTAAARGLLMIADLQGRPSQDYHLAMQWLGRAHGELDRLYWPAALVEAQTLFAKDNAAAAIKAIDQTLSLNPNSSDGWYLLGRAAVSSFDFDRGEKCVEKLRMINPDHPLAYLVAGHMYLQQKDGEQALESANALLEKYPNHREAIAIKATAQRLIDPVEHDGNEVALLEPYDKLTPGGSDAYITMGAYLSLARQYHAAGRVLSEAIERHPNSATAYTELGLMLMQLGDEPAAREALAEAARLDPFNIRAQNQYELAMDLAEYAEVRTEHFIIRFPEGELRVLAEEMARPLEKIYDDITGAYQYEPENPTIIEVLPDEPRFGVRITGMPDIWTIAACTGDVIAMVPPREGARQRGTFDWERVIRHEYVHTVTLNQTQFRIPHWFTEACAVSQEPGGRDYGAYQLLAAAYLNDGLFNLKEINWAFVRPKKPSDRAQAYAQAHWMYEYISEKHGHQAIIHMLEMYRDGVGDVKAVEEATGQSAADFMSGFKNWAGQQVQAWGLHDDAKDPRIAELLSKRPIDDEQLGKLLTEMPDHPVLLQISAALAIKAEEYDDATQLVERYAKVRPVDPWIDRARLRIALHQSNAKAAIAPLKRLDARESTFGDYAYQLAELYRQTNNIEGAQTAAKRALWREPFNGKFRELAATIALQAGDFEEALHQMKALAALEPHQAIHQLRIAAILQKLGRTDEAREAALNAQALNPNVKVDRFFD